MPAGSYDFGPFSISGSFISVSGSFNMTGSIISSTGSLMYLPFVSGAFTTSSMSYLTGSSIGTPFLYVINGVLFYFNGSTWARLFP